MGEPAVAINEPAPDFTLPDFAGRPFRLSSLKGQRHVLLVFNRGFL
jgi:peroxiredoxin